MCPHHTAYEIITKENIGKQYGVPGIAHILCGESGAELLHLIRLAALVYAAYPPLFTHQGLLGLAPRGFVPVRKHTSNLIIGLPTDLPLPSRTSNSRCREHQNGVVGVWSFLRELSANALLISGKFSGSRLPGSQKNKIFESF